MAMDRTIQKEGKPWWQWGLIAAAAIALLWVAYSFLQNSSLRSVELPASQLIISTVRQGQLEDIASVRGTVQPLNSVFLDAVNGGVVEEIFVDEGSYVTAGQALLQLSNTDLRLSVAGNDTAITEQLNNLNNITNGLETTKLNTQREIINLEYRIITLERQRRRQQELVNDRLVSQEEFDKIIDELEYQHKLLANTRARQTLENKIREERQLQIEQQISKLEENLSLSQRSFESLLVRAPISGQLTSLPVQLGESKNRGERLGQIDVIDQYKISAPVDEFYISRVSPGQAARFTLSGETYSVVVDKTYPEVNNGSFIVDMIFTDNLPATLRRGQTLQLELTLGSPEETLLLPVGSFIQETGGNWVFVLNENGRQAFRKEISTGRRNNRFIEVREGLSPGDRVITSGYGAMIGAERIELTE